MENYLPKNVLPITAWAEEDKPREKLMEKGKSSLSDAELLAILLGSGSREETAVSLAQRILNLADNDLNELGKCSIPQLKAKFKGVGDAKAVTIVAAMELGRRRQLTDIRQKPKIVSSKDAYNLIAPKIMDLPHEEFWLLYLNRGCKVIGRELLSVGGINATIVDSRIVFRKALENEASCIILVHNHPSGNPNPSQADIDLTKKLVQAGRILNVLIIDHVIVADTDYFSFADEGMLE